MTNKVVKFDDQGLEKLSSLLEQAIEIYEKDRERAIKNYDGFKDQLKDILELDVHMSEDASIEKQMNTALKLVFQASERLDKVINTITQIIVNQLNNESKERMIDNLGNLGDKVPKKPINFNDFK